MTQRATTKLLIVDDDPLNLEILQELLEDDYELVTAETGEEALNEAVLHRPDVVLLDIMMPGIDGYETCRRMRSTNVLDNVKIVLVSAKAMVSERLEGYAAGADDYMSKPFNKDELRAKVKVFAQLRRAEEMEQLKSRLLRQMEYEVRTPLTGILPAAESLRDGGDLASEDRVLCADIIIDGARRLVRMVDQSALLGQLKEGTAALYETAHIAADLIRDSLVGVSDLLLSRRVVLQENLDASARAFGDRRYLTALIQALVQVALNGMGSDQELLIECRPYEDGCEIDFKRKGQGELQAHTDETAFSLPLAEEVLLFWGGAMDVSGEEDAEWRCRVQLPHAIVRAPVTQAEDHGARL